MTGERVETKVIITFMIMPHLVWRHGFLFNWGIFAFHKGRNVRIMRIKVWILQVSKGWLEELESSWKLLLFVFFSSKVSRETRPVDCMNHLAGSFETKIMFLLLKALGTSLNSYHSGNDEDISIEVKFSFNEIKQANKKPREAHLPLVIVLKNALHSLLNYFEVHPQLPKGILAI